MGCTPNFLQPIFVPPRASHAPSRGANLPTYLFIYLTIRNLKIRNKEGESELISGEISCCKPAYLLFHLLFLIPYFDFSYGAWKLCREISSRRDSRKAKPMGLLKSPPEVEKLVRRTPWSMPWPAWANLYEGRCPCEGVPSNPITNLTPTFTKLQVLA